MDKGTHLVAGTEEMVGGSGGGDDGGGGGGTGLERMVAILNVSERAGGVSGGDDRAELGWWSAGAGDHTLHWGPQREEPVRKGKHQDTERK